MVWWRSRRRGGAGLGLLALLVQLVLSFGHIHPEDLRPADPVPWIKAACNDARVTNRITDSLAGIYGIEPDGPPTIDMFGSAVQ